MHNICYKFIFVLEDTILKSQKTFPKKGILDKILRWKKFVAEFFAHFPFVKFGEQPANPIRQFADGGKHQQPFFFANAVDYCIGNIRRLMDFSGG